MKNVFGVKMRSVRNSRTNAIERKAKDIIFNLFKSFTHTDLSAKRLTYFKKFDLRFSPTKQVWTCEWERLENVLQVCSHTMQMTASNFCEFTG